MILFNVVFIATTLLIASSCVHAQLAHVTPTAPVNPFGDANANATNV